jgi:adenylate cyclase
MALPRCISCWRFGPYIAVANGACRSSKSLRLASGFSLPLILIGHVVTTRLADTLFGVTPSYTAVIASLQMSGREGLQLALLAPGWVHGCLGLWITLRRSAFLRSIKYALVGLLFLLLSLAALGFFRMATEIAMTNVLSPERIEASLHAATLAHWKDNLTIGYLCAIALAVAAGWLRRVNGARPGLTPV